MDWLEVIRGLENITERRRLKEVSQFRDEMSEMSLWIGKMLLEWKKE